MKIIILHGWGQNKIVWSNLISKFGNNAIALDLPGFGSEPLVSYDWGVPEYVEWVINKISNYKNVVLIGHSFGGRIAAEIASKNPKNIDFLVLSGAPCLYRPTLGIQTRIRIYKLLKFLIPKNYRKLFYSQDLRESNKLEKVFRKVVLFDQTDQLKKIRVKTLLIWGENDISVPLRIAKEIKSLIKHSKLKIIEGAGHNVFLEKPDLFYGYVTKFISNH